MSKYFRHVSVAGLLALGAGVAATSNTAGAATAEQRVYYGVYSTSTLPVKAPGAACTKAVATAPTLRAKMAKTQWNTLLMCGVLHTSSGDRYHYSYVTVDKATEQKVCTTDGYYRSPDNGVTWFPLSMQKRNTGVCGGPVVGRVMLSNASLNA